MLRKLWYLLNRGRLERELEEEMSFHAEQAGQRFGDATRWRERSRDEWGLRAVDETLQDIRYTLRGLRRQPGFVIAALLLLTFGVTANVAVFSVVRAVILSSLPVRDSASLVQLGFYDPAEGEVRPDHNDAAFEMFTREARTVHDLFGFSVAWEANAVFNGTAELVHAQAVTANAFEVLSVGFGPDPATVAVSHAYAMRRGLGPGSALTVNAIPFTVARVLPESFRGFSVGETPEVYFHADRVNQVLMRTVRNPANSWMRIMGRLRPGVTVEQARAELDPIARRAIEHLYAHMPASIRPQVRQAIDQMRFTIIPAQGGAQSELRDEARTPLLVLLGSAGLLLLIACANLTGLSLARSAARQREFTLRVALGCGRGRLLRQMLTESLLLAVCAGAAALLLEPVARRAVSSMIVDVDIGQRDGVVLAFALLVTMLAGILVGVVPAFRACSKARLVEDRTPRSPRLANALIAVQVGMSVVLVAGAGLFAQTFRSYRNIDPGYRREELVTVMVNPGTMRYNRQRLVSYYRAALERLRAVPGVASVTLSRWPMGELNWTTIIEAAGLKDRATRNLAGPRFAATMSIPILSGRDFNDLDVQRPTALVNQAFVRRFFAGANPVGHKFQMIGPDKFEIIGVLRDARDRGPKHSVRPVVYTAWENDPMGFMTFNVRTRRSPESAIADVRAALRSLDAQVPITAERTAEAVTDRQLRRELMMASFGTLFAALAVVVASVGLFALLAHSVVRRTREIGVRMAVGATRAQIVAVILRHSVSLLLAGVAVGIPLAVACGWAVQSQLHGVTPADPVLLGSVAVLISVAAAAASVVPALRALRIDPVDALRHD